MAIRVRPLPTVAITRYQFVTSRRGTGDIAEIPRYIIKRLTLLLGQKEKVMSVDVVHANAGANDVEYHNGGATSPLAIYRILCHGAGACRITSSVSGSVTALANLTVGQAGVVEKPIGGNLRIGASGSTYTVVTIEKLSLN
jgi:hypothetical protein